MKKKILGITVTALLLGGSIGFAAATSPLIGAKVEGLFTVQKSDGTKIGDAIIINGTAYAPVRAISDATGTQLTVEGKQIIIEDIVESSPAIEEKKKAELVDIQARKASIEEEIEKKKAHISDLEKNVIPPLESMAKELANNGTLGIDAQKSADDYKALLAQRKQELAYLQALLAQIKTQLGE